MEATLQQFQRDKRVLLEENSRLKIQLRDKSTYLSEGTALLSEGEFKKLLQEY